MRRWFFRGALIGLVVLAVLGAAGARLDLLHVAFQRPEGTGAWRASRAAGIAAYAALSLDVIFGLLVSTGSADRWIARARSVEVHRFLSGASLWLVAAHAVALLADRFIRFDVLDLLVPFVAAHRPVGVALGVIGMYAAVVVHVSFDLRPRIGARAWRRLHYLAFAVFALATAHGLAAGTDAGLGFMRALYLGATAATLLLTSVRVLGALRARPIRSAT